MDAARTALVRELLADTAWLGRTRAFAGSLRRSTQRVPGLLLVGTPTAEPWHLTAHLDDEARLAGLESMAPTLVRWAPPPGAPAHLAIGLERLEQVRRGETVFVVAPDDPGEALLERVSDARHTGATVLALDAGDRDLAGLAHDELVVPPGGLWLPSSARAPRTTSVVGADAEHPEIDEDAFDIVEHLVSTAVGEGVPSGGAPIARRGFRDRLGRLLDSIQGSSDESGR